MPAQRQGGGFTQPTCQAPPSAVHLPIAASLASLARPARPLPPRAAQGSGGVGIRCPADRLAGRMPGSCLGVRPRGVAFDHLVKMSGLGQVMAVSDVVIYCTKAERLHQVRAHTPNPTRIAIPAS